MKELKRVEINLKKMKKMSLLINKKEGERT